MGNPIMELMQQNSRQRQGNNPMEMLAEFKKFAAGITPAQAEQKIQQLLTSGQMSQAQYQQLRHSRRFCSASSSGRSTTG